MFILYDILSDVSSDTVSATRPNMSPVSISTNLPVGSQEQDIACYRRFYLTQRCEIEACIRTYSHTCKLVLIRPKLVKNRVLQKPFRKLESLEKNRHTFFTSGAFILAWCLSHWFAPLLGVCVQHQRFPFGASRLHPQLEEAPT